jgi:hypothetical protein
LGFTGSWQLSGVMCFLFAAKGLRADCISEWAGSWFAATHRYAGKMRSWRHSKPGSRRWLQFFGHVNACIKPDFQPA